MTLERVGCRNVNACFLFEYFGNDAVLQIDIECELPEQTPDIRTLRFIAAANHGIDRSAAVIGPEVLVTTEPPRIWWRLQLLRKWSHEQVEQIFY